MVEITAHESRDRRHTFQEDGSFDIVISKVEVSTPEEERHDTGGSSVAHPLRLAFWLNTPILFENGQHFAITVHILLNKRNNWHSLHVYCRCDTHYWVSSRFVD